MWLIIKLLTALRKFQKSHNISSKTVTDGHNKEVPKERYISLIERQKVVDNLRLI